MAFLPTIVAESAQTRQTFSKSGATTYTNQGFNSFGVWRVQAGTYCSQWPPAGGWECYNMFVNDEKKRIIWVDQNGNRTENTFSFR